MTDPANLEDHQEPVHISETQAKGAQRVGLIWMLLGSLLAGVVVLAAVLIFFSGSLGEADRRGGPTTIGKAQAANFHVPGG